MKDKKMELIQLGPRTYYVTGLFHVGVFVLEENIEVPKRKVCLIDSGLDADGATEIDQLLEAYDFEVAVIINTHYHADHCGGNSYFKNKYQCRIFSTQINAALMSNYDACPSMVWGGWPIPEILNSYFYATPADAEILDEKKLPKGLTIEHLPGHSISMIAVRTEDDVLFLGDAVVAEETIMKHPLTYIYEIDDALESLSRLEKIPAAFFVPYHAEMVTDITNLARKNREGILYNLQALKRICVTPHCLDEIIKAFFDEHQMKLTLYRYAVEGSVVKTYISYLYWKKELKLVQEDNLIKWQTV